LENSGITVSALLLLFLTAGMGLIGFLDDYIKISNQRSLGLTPTGKIVGQGAVGITFAVLALNFPSAEGLTPASTAISVFRDTSWDLAFFGATAGAILFVLWSNLITTATTNAVNLTDGLDGLATGAVAMVAAGYVLITLFQSNQSCNGRTHAGGGYEVRGRMAVALLGSSPAGVLVGF